MDMNIRKVLFFDLETVGRTATYEDLEKENPRMAALWAAWQEKYKETNGDATLNELWENKAGLHAEYGKVVCASFGYYDKDMNMKITSFYGHDEKDILTKCLGVMNNADKNGMYLGGHTIERFDVPFLWKRMLANGLNPPQIISVWDKKPWDLKFFDICKVWSDGAWKESFTSLDTMSAIFDVETPKGALKGSMVHNSYWNENGIEAIKTYCEGDVRATIEVANKLIEITKPHESLVH
jgi:hypothetical protein